MELIRTVKEMQAWAEKNRAQGVKIGLVPTMGYLHSGHLSLMKIARPLCDKLVVSVFVNPMQFGPKEDLAEYPRDLERDLDMIKDITADAVFHPEAEEMYPEGFQTQLEVTGVGRGLCQTYRPQFFIGVATVVLKLFNCVKPHLAVFGEKDYQQLTVIRRMVRDLNLDIQIVGGPLIREADGLALSSRNVYLSAEERTSALAISQSLETAKAMAAAGRVEAAEILQAVRARIEAGPHNKVQYAALVDPETLADVDRVADTAVLALAVLVGKTRLIDNCLIKAEE